MSGVNALHEVQLIHKDLNFKKILCENVGNNKVTLKIVDVDVLKTDFQEASNVSIFDPPEGTSINSEKVDVWACGMIFYYISHRKEICKFNKIFEYVSFISSFSYDNYTHTAIPWLESVISKCLISSLKERATVKELLELLKINIPPSPSHFFSPLSQHFPTGNPDFDLSYQVVDNICPYCQKRPLQVLENNTKKKCVNCFRVYSLNQTSNLFVVETPGY